MSFKQSIDALYKQNHILNTHKENIAQSHSNNTTHYSIQEAISWMFLILEKSKRVQPSKSMKEKEVVLLYIEILSKFRSELKKAKSFFAIESKYLGEIDSTDFLQDINRFVLQDITDLQTWDSCISNLDRYFIHHRSLIKLANKMKLIDQDVIRSDRKQEINEARNCIRKVLKSFSEEEIQNFEKIKQGKSGLKKAVMERISNNDFRKLFQSSEVNFKNRWDEVRRGK